LHLGGCSDIHFKHKKDNPEFTNKVIGNVTDGAIRPTTSN